MIKMSYEKLSNVNFQQAVQKLLNKPMKTPSAFQILHIGKALQAKNDEMRHKFSSEIVEKYSNKDHKPVEGEVSKSMKMEIPFEAVQGKEEEAVKAIEDFGKTIFEIPIKKISSETLFSVGEWSPVELQFLEPLVEVLAAVPSETPKA